MACVNIECSRFNLNCGKHAHFLMLDLMADVSFSRPVRSKPHRRDLYRSRIMYR
jgi:hypothetical protein